MIAVTTCCTYLNPLLLTRVWGHSAEDFERGLKLNGGVPFPWTWDSFRGWQPPERNASAEVCNMTVVLTQVS